MKFYPFILFLLLLQVGDTHKMEKRINQNLLKPVRKAQKFMIHQIRLHERQYIDNYSLYLSVKNYLDELIKLQNEFIVGDEFFKQRKIEKYLERIKRSIVSRQNGYGFDGETNTLFMKNWIIYIDHIRTIQDRPGQVIQRVRRG